jgi:hypothetical protein
MLRCSKLCELTITPGKLEWPWVAFTPERTAFAVPVGPRTVAIRAATSLDRERRVELPDALAVPTIQASHDATTSRQPGLHALALHPDERTVVGLGWHRDIPVACVERVGGAAELVDLGPALGEMGPLAASFTRDGESIWVSAESATGAAIARIRFRDFGLESKVTFPPAPPPAHHELLLHPVEDAVLLAMACGQDGTFVRVARMTAAKLDLAPGEGDGGLEPCGLAETTEEGARVCFVAAERVVLRRWPDMALVANVQLGEETAANYNGLRTGGRFVVSATDEEAAEEERAMVLSDALRIESDDPAPPGMWAGRLGRDRLVTVGRDGGEAWHLYVYAMEV